MPSSTTLERESAAGDRRTASMEFFAENDQLIVEGTQPRVIVGDVGDEPLVVDEDVPMGCGKSYSVPRMAFHGKADTVLSGADITVGMPGIPERPTQGVSGEETINSDCRTTLESLKPVDDYSPSSTMSSMTHHLDSMSVSSKGYGSDLSDEEVSEEVHFSSDDPLEDVEEIGFPRLPSRRTENHLHFYTQANKMTVQGVGMTITFGGQLGNKPIFQRSSRGPGFALHNMTFRSKNTGLVVRGSDGFVEVNPRPRLPSEGTPVQESKSCQLNHSSTTHSAVVPRKPSDYRSLEAVPIRALSYEIRLKLALLLDPSCPGRDWKSFADRINMPYEEIRHISERQEYPTMKVLDRWETEGEFTATVGRMLMILAELDRKDAITTLTDMILQGTN